MDCGVGEWDELVTDTGGIRRRGFQETEQAMVLREARQPVYSPSKNGDAGCSGDLGEGGIKVGGGDDPRARR